MCSQRVNSSLRAGKSTTDGRVFFVPGHGRR